MGKVNNSEAYYRDLCKKLSQQLQLSNERQRASVNEVRRAKLNSVLTRQLFRYKAAKYSAQQVSERMLSALCRHMGLESGALYVRDPKIRGFSTLAFSGFADKSSCDLSHKSAMPEFVCVAAENENSGVSHLLDSITHTDKTVWCFHQGSGLALLLGGNDNERAWDLSIDDRTMLHTLLEMTANVVNEADTRVSATKELLDPLTGLPNRHLVLDHLERESRKQESNWGSGTAVFYIDIDRFSHINQQTSHVVGDKVLMAVAHQLRAALRPGDLLGRIGVDEFVIIAPGQRLSSDANIIATRILKKFRKPLRVAGYSFYMSLSIGIAETLPNRAAVETVKDANVAMFHAKSKGGAGYVSFGQELRRPSASNMKLEQELRQALAREELSLYYQPIFSLQSGAVVALEALLRWHHPRKGMLTPNKFMPLAEQSEIAVEIGNWVIEKTVRDLNIWSSEDEANKTISVCINIDESQFVQKRFAQQLGIRLRRGGIDPQRIRLEISEQTLQACRALEKPVLHNLRDMGVKLMLDDFGTGSSSLERLQNLPIDTIKIDQSFVEKMALGGRHQRLMKAMIELAQNLNKQIVAEGVEQEDQLSMLRELGCDFAQGYILGRPMSASRIGDFLNNQELIVGRSQ